MTIPIDQLEGVLVRVEAAVNSEFLSKWSFERQLDTVARALKRYMEDSLSANDSAVEVGCSILYRLPEDPNRCVLGGGSTDRRRMSAGARCYNLADESTGFTAFSVARDYKLVFDDFKKAVDQFGNTMPPLVRHRNQDCEQQASQTRSFLCYPILHDASATLQARRVRAPEEVEGDRGQSMAIGAVRFSSSAGSIGNRLDQLLEPSLVHRLCTIIQVGRSSVQSNAVVNQGLAVADLYLDMLRYRTREYVGLDQLAFHLQTIFGRCEVSVFVAHEVAGCNIVPLYLAVTTALGRQDQQARFRETFGADGQHYLCHYDRDGNPLENQSRWTKTEAAYYKPNEVLLEVQDPTSIRFAGRGEVSESGSFMAVAIPGQAGSRPYGVIRVVTEKERKFENADKQLLNAVARLLGPWAELFPYQRQLEIDWGDLRLRNEAVKNLQGRSNLHTIDDEIEWLLRKLFCESKKIAINSCLSIEPEKPQWGVVELRVTDADGIQKKVRCERKNLKYAFDTELLARMGSRETRHLIGFAEVLIPSAEVFYERELEPETEQRLIALLTDVITQTQREDQKDFSLRIKHKHGRRFCTIEHLPDTPKTDIRPPQRESGIDQIVDEALTPHDSRSYSRAVEKIVQGLLVGHLGVIQTSQPSIQISLQQTMGDRQADPHIYEAIQALQNAREEESDGAVLSALSAIEQEITALKRDKDLKQEVVESGLTRIRKGLEELGKIAGAANKTYSNVAPAVRGAIEVFSRLIG
ncbi:MAG: hypothetical protein GYB33_01440 [Gammaproteobacteria bacterium]|nr:hypothetical protein [Gammaproteobacteria bacterium]